MSVGELNLSLMEYYDRTIFELSVEFQGYNRRWEEQWRHTRKLYTPMQNAIAKKPKREFEWISLPSDSEMMESRSKFENMKEALKLEHSVKNGSGINS